MDQTLRLDQKFSTNHQTLPASNNRQNFDSPVGLSEFDQEETARLIHRRRIRIAQRTASVAVSCMRGGR